MPFHYKHTQTHTHQPWHTQNCIQASHQLCVTRSAVMIPFCKWGHGDLKKLSNYSRLPGWGRLSPVTQFQMLRLQVLPSFPSSCPVWDTYLIGSGRFTWYLEITLKNAESHARSFLFKFFFSLSDYVKEKGSLGGSTPLKHLLMSLFDKAFHRQHCWGRILLPFCCILFKFLFLFLKQVLLAFQGFLK